MKINNNLILSLSVLVLIVLSFFSIYSPIRFDREQQRREQIVRRHMLALGKAEQAYLHRHGVYTGCCPTACNTFPFPTAESSNCKPPSK